MIDQLARQVNKRSWHQPAPLAEQPLAERGMARDEAVSGQPSRPLRLLRGSGALLCLLISLLCIWQGSGVLIGDHQPDRAVASPDRARLHAVSVSHSPGGVPLAGMRIDEIDVGQWVLAENPVEEDDAEFGIEVIPGEWRLLDLRAPKEDGTYADVRMLRPRWWIEQQWRERYLAQVATLVEFNTDQNEKQLAWVVSDDLTNPMDGSRIAGPPVWVPPFDEQRLVGETLYVSVPECGIDGDAHVLAIGKCPQISPRPGPEFQVVTATFHHRAARVLDLSVTGLPSAIGTTANHPFWSEDRQQFVHADELTPGEHLRIADGTLSQVTSVTPPPRHARRVQPGSPGQARLPCGGKRCVGPQWCAMHTISRT
jgi:hypothetical protein